MAHFEMIAGPDGEVAGLVADEFERGDAQATQRVVWQAPGPRVLGGSFFALRGSRGYQQVTVVWQGRFEDQDPSLRSRFISRI